MCARSELRLRFCLLALCVPNTRAWALALACACVTERVHPEPVWFVCHRFPAPLASGLGLCTLGLWPWPVCAATACLPRSLNTARTCAGACAEAAHKHVSAAPLVLAMGVLEKGGWRWCSDEPNLNTPCMSSAFHAHKHLVRALRLSHVQAQVTKQQPCLLQQQMPLPALLLLMVTPLRRPFQLQP